MHEFGHNLGLRHGGGDGVNYKPNYLSIMNYAFQFVGLRSRTEPPRFDYSRFAIALDERALNENAGFGVTAGSPAADFVTSGSARGPRGPSSPSGGRTWRGTWSSPATSTATRASPRRSRPTSTPTAPSPRSRRSRTGPNLVYDGGLVGPRRAVLPDRTEMDEPQVSELRAARDAIEALLAAGSDPDADPHAGSGLDSPPAPAGAGAGCAAPPALAGLALRPERVRRPRDAVRGARVAYRLSEAGRVRFRVERELPGRRRGGRCVDAAPGPARPPLHARGRRCAGASSTPAGPGRTRSASPARMGGRALRPGRYVLVATPLAADGRAGRPVRVRFRIVALTERVRCPP